MKSSITSMGRALALALFAVLLLAPSADQAQVPRTINYQGSLTDNAGAPVSGTVDMTFRLYDALGATIPVWAERQTVTVTNGAFSVVFGADATNPLQDSFFETALFLGIAVGGDAEMTPRQALASAPQAIRAKTAENVFPTGAIMLFDLDACPTGWSAIEMARGRALVGLPAGGSRGWSVGDALTNLENRTHRHDVDPLPRVSADTVDHDHGVAGGTFTTDPRGGHSHPVNPPPTTSDPDEHNHAWSVFSVVNSLWRSHNSLGTQTDMMNWGDGMDSAGAGHFPISLNAPSGSPKFFYTDNDEHSHSTDIANFSSELVNAHSHPLTITARTTSPSGRHAHSVNIPNTTSTDARTGNVMPYIQFLVCRKD